MATGQSGKHLELNVGANIPISVAQLRADITTISNELNKGGGAIKLKVALNTADLRKQITSAMSGSGSAGGNKSPIGDEALLRQAQEITAKFNATQWQSVTDGAAKMNQALPQFSEYTQKVTACKNAVDALNVSQLAINNGKITGGSLGAEQVQRATEAYRQMVAAQSVAVKASKQGLNTKSIDLGFEKILNRATTFEQEIQAAAGRLPGVTKQWDEFQQKLRSGGYEHSSEGIKQATKDLNRLQTDLISAGMTTETMSQKLKRLFSSSLGSALMTTAAGSLIASLRNLYTNIVKIDSALTQVEIVTGQSGGAMRKFASDASEAAQRVSASVGEIIKSSETYARLGYSMSDSLKLSEVTSAYSNIAATSVDDATSSLTAVLKAFSSQYSQQDAERVADILTEVGQKYAISASELGVALQNGGAAMQVANNSLEQSVALLAAGNAAVQDASKTGNALKTTTMRIRGASAELEEAGEEVGEFCTSSSKLRDTVLGLAKFDIMIDDTTFKSTYDIMVGIAKQWDSMTDVNRASLLEAIAGKRNASVIQSVITNIKDLEGAYAAALGAEGALGKANDIYINSIAGRSAQAKAAFQTFSNTVLNSELISGTFKMGTGLIQGLTLIADKLTVIPLLATAAGAALSFKNAGRRDQNMPGYARCNLCA